jgi:tetratricopeptide (TPR) repeat protein
MDTGAPAPRSLPSLDIDDLEPVDNEQDAAGSLATGALPADGAEPAGEDGPVIQPIEIKKRRSKLPVLIVIVLLLAAAIAALQFFILPNMQRAQAYRQALEQMEAQDYSSAMQSFDELDGYNDSRYYIAQCQLYIAYHDAMDMFEQGRFSEAFDAFNLLSMQSFLDSAAMTKKSLYNIADAQLKKGAREEAFLSFSALGDFEDAAARATSCLVAQPLTGPVQKAAAGDGATALIKVQIDGAKMDQPSFMKLYGKDGALVTSVFLRAKDSLTVELPAGTYRLNQATGANWFGTEIMFGTRGVYTTLHFNESDELVLESLHEYKITLGDSSRGNVNSQAIDAGAF